MRIRSLSLLAALLSCSFLFVACAPEGDDDDDDGGFPTPTPTPSGTATPTPSGTPGPTPAPITVMDSFVTGDGTELWLCVETLFDGQVEAAFTDDGGTCTGTAVIEGATEASATTPGYTTLLLEGVTGCANTDHDWWIDYLVDDGDCEGCINREFIATIAAGDSFGSFCGAAGGASAVAALEAYKSNTTGDDRFHADVGNFTVEIDDLLVYEQGGGTRLTECSPGVTIQPGTSDAIFDGNCNPADMLVSGDTYTAILKGNLNGAPFRSTFDFPYLPTPGP